MDDSYQYLIELDEGEAVIYQLFMQLWTFLICNGHVLLFLKSINKNKFRINGSL